MKTPLFLLLATFWVLGLLSAFIPLAFRFELSVLGIFILALYYNRGLRTMELRPAYARRSHAHRP